VDLEINKVNRRLLEQGLSMRLSDAAGAWLAEKGYDPDYGARPLRRIIQLEIEDRLSDHLLNGHFHAGDLVQVDVSEGEITMQRSGGETDQAEEPDSTETETVA